MDIISEAEQAALAAWTRQAASGRRRTRLILQLVKSSALVAAMSASLSSSIMMFSPMAQEAATIEARRHWLATAAVLQAMGSDEQRIERLAALVEARSRRLASAWLQAIADGSQAALELLAEVERERRAEL